MSITSRRVHIFKKSWMNCHFIGLSYRQDCHRLRWREHVCVIRYILSVSVYTNRSVATETWRHRLDILLRQGHTRSATFCGDLLFLLIHAKEFFLILSSVSMIHLSITWKVRMLLQNIWRGFVGNVPINISLYVMYFQIYETRLLWPFMVKKVHSERVQCMEGWMK